MRLAGKVSVITGAGAGMGEAAARLFAREGSKVVVNDLDVAAGERVARAIVAEGGDASFQRGDVTVAKDVRELFDRTLDRYGKLDVLYNNAGSSHGVYGKLGDIAEDAWDRVIDTNVKGTFLCCKYGVPALLANGGGSIINVSSAVGLVGWPGGSALCAAKGAVALLTKAMALDYADDNIRVNALCPGSILTSQSAPALERAQSEDERRAIIERLTKQHAMKRLGRPEEVAQTALFLASDESSFITGALISVDGGWTAH